MISTDQIKELITNLGYYYEEELLPYNEDYKQFKIFIYKKDVIVWKSYVYYDSHLELSDIQAGIQIDYNRMLNEVVKKGLG